MTAKGDDREVSALIAGRLRDLGRSQKWLGEAVAERLDVKAFSQSTVSAWATGAVTPSPAQVFAMEHALELGPGDLSRHWGYLPLVARKPACGVEAAVKADPHLPQAAKKALVAAYKELRKL